MAAVNPRDGGLFDFDALALLTHRANLLDLSAWLLAKRHVIDVAFRRVDLYDAATNRWIRDYALWLVGGPMLDDKHAIAVEFERLIEDAQHRGLTPRAITVSEDGSVILSWVYGDTWRRGPLRQPVPEPPAGQPETLPTTHAPAPAGRLPVPLLDTEIVRWTDQVEVPDYPYGRFRTRAVWRLEHDARRGDRVGRQTLDPRSGHWGAAKYTTYEPRMVLGVGADGRTYILADHGGGMVSITGGTMDRLKTYHRSDKAAAPIIERLLTSAWGSPEDARSPAKPASKPGLADMMKDEIWKRKHADYRGGSKAAGDRSVMALSPEGATTLYPLDGADEETLRYLYRVVVAQEKRPLASEIATELREALAPLFAGAVWHVTVHRVVGYDSVLITIYDAPEGSGPTSGVTLGYDNAPYSIRISIGAAEGFRWPAEEQAPPRLHAYTVWTRGRDTFRSAARRDLTLRARSDVPNKVVEYVIKWLREHASEIVTVRRNRGVSPTERWSMRTLTALSRRAGLFDLADWLRAEGALLRGLESSADSSLESEDLEPYEGASAACAIPVPRCAPPRLAGGSNA